MTLPAYKFERKISRVAVIGAGASGLAAVKVLQAENAFDITVYERNGESGGLWNYTDSIDDVRIPSVDPSIAVPPVAQTWTGASYEGLISNVPASIMFYENEEYNKQTEYFATRTDVAEFLHVYGREVDGLISYHTSVTDVRKVEGQWILKYERDGQEGEANFDAVVVACGYFNLPYVPEVEGMKAYAEAFPGKILHSKTYRWPQAYKDQTVLVVGNSASALDIANQLVQRGTKVYQSIRSKSTFGHAFPGVRVIDEVEYFNAQDGSIRIKGGQVLTDVDVVIYATGYLKNLPFLSDINSGPEPLITHGLFVDNLYLNFVYIPDPTLAILGIPRFVIPFRISQAQACLIARVWSGRLHLPPKRVMELYYQIRLLETGDTKEFHDLKFPTDADFCEYVRELCELSGGHGIAPRKWTPAERTLRARMIDVRFAYSQYLIDTGKHAKDEDELINAGLLTPLETDTTVPDFRQFGKVVDGKVVDGTEYTEDDVIGLAKLAKPAD